VGGGVLLCTFDMDKKKLALLGLFGSLIWLSVFYFPDDKLNLVFCDVGQGDAVLITKGFDQILIDGGPDDKVLTCLSENMPFWDKKIEIVALTHPEADHLSGLLAVLDKYEVDFFLTGPEGDSSAKFAELSSKLKDQSSKLTRRNPYEGEKIKLGEITLETLWPEREWVANKISNSERVLGASTSGHLNDFSLVFLLSFRNKKVLLMGDADSRVQDKILSAVGGSQLAVSGVDILKFPHHGSKTGMTEEFLETISPKEAVISVGKNSYGHPTKEALDLLEKFGVLIRRTDLEGEIRYSF